MTDRSRRDLLTRYAPAVAAFREPVMRDAYCWGLAVLAGCTDDVPAVTRAVAAARPVADDDVIALLNLLSQARNRARPERTR